LKNKINQENDKKKIVIKRMKKKSNIKIKWNKIIRDEIENKINQENKEKKIKNSNKNNEDQIWQIKKLKEDEI
jgi:hypothetical protein